MFYDRPLDARSGEALHPTREGDSLAELANTGHRRAQTKAGHRKKAEYREIRQDWRIDKATENIRRNIKKHN